MTTPTLTKGEEVAVGLKQRAHWRVLIEPHRYGRVFESPHNALDAVRASVVRIGVEEFPVIDSYKNAAHNSAIDGGWEGWAHYGRTEAWRVTCSGQFVAIVGVEEDLPGYDMGSNTLHLRIATRNVMEFIGFARRFTKVSAHRAGPSSVQLSLRNVEGRTLTTSLPALMRRPYTANARRLDLLEHDFPSERSETPYLVERVLLSELFSRFGWEPPVQVLDDLIAKTASSGL